MTKNIKNLLKTSVLVISGSLMMWNCESEADNLGSQFFEGATGTTQSYEVISYNISNNDTIRTDASKLAYATLGAFNEPQFGLQKSSYVSQARLSSDNPDFGANAVVDSVVLSIKPLYAADSATTVTNENYTFTGNIAAKKVETTYPVKKYGKGLPLTLKVHQVDDFLGAASDAVYSNKNVNYSTLLGSKVIAPKVSTVKITKKSDNSDLASSDATFTIPLNKTYFQNMIINKKGQPELSDTSNFIRYFKGIRLSVEENDGYIFKFNPNDVAINIYYKRDVTASGTTTATPATYTLSLGASNAKFNQIYYDRSNTPVQSALNTSDKTNGDAKIFAQGMGGPSFGIKIPGSEIEKLRALYKNEKVGILSAKIRMYTDETSWNNKFEKPSTFTTNYIANSATKEMDLKTFLDDVAAFSKTNLITAYDLDKNPAYYDFSITQSLKNFVEKQVSPKEFGLSIGEFIVNSQTGMPAGPSVNTRAYTPHRIVLVGSKDKASAKRMLLNVVYVKK